MYREDHFREKILFLRFNRIKKKIIPVKWKLFFVQLKILCKNFIIKRQVAGLDFIL
jgi:hypothetical protein